MENAKIYNEFLMHKIMKNKISDDDTTYSETTDTSYNEDENESIDNEFTDTSYTEYDKDKKILELENIIKRIMKKNRLLHERIQLLEKEK